MTQMARAAKYEIETGRITGIREGDYLPLPAEGMAYRDLEADEVCDPDRHRIVDRQIVPVETISLEALTRHREVCKNEARALRDRIVEQGCATPLGRVQTDAVSQTNIMGAMAMAQAALVTGAPFSMTWRMEDNTLVPHDAAATIAMALTVGQHKAACYAAGFAICDAIDASDDPHAVSIAVGYPMA